MNIIIIFYIIKRTDCLCAQNITEWLDGGDCYVNCIGDDQQMCGGSYIYYSVYKTINLNNKNAIISSSSFNKSNKINLNLKLLIGFHFFLLIIFVLMSNN